MAQPNACAAGESVAAAARQVSQDVAKCAVMWGMGGIGASEAASLLAALCASVQAFAAQCSSVAAGGGTTLRVRFYVCLCESAFLFPAPGLPLHVRAMQHCGCHRRGNPICDVLHLKCYFASLPSSPGLSEPTTQKLF